MLESPKSAMSTVRGAVVGHLRRVIEPRLRVGETQGRRLRYATNFFAEKKNSINVLLSPNDFLL